MIAASLAVLAAIVLLLLCPRRGKPRRTPGQLLVRLLYWISRETDCVAKGADQVRRSRSE